MASRPNTPSTIAAKRAGIAAALTGDQEIAHAPSAQMLCFRDRLQSGRQTEKNGGRESHDERKPQDPAAGAKRRGDRKIEIRLSGTEKPARAKGNGKSEQTTAHCEQQTFGQKLPEQLGWFGFVSQRTRDGDLQPTLSNFAWDLFRRTDLPLVAAQSAPRRIHLAGAVDASERAIASDELRRIYSSGNVEISNEPDWDERALAGV